MKKKVLILLFIFIFLFSLNFTSVIACEIRACIWNGTGTSTNPELYINFTVILNYTGTLYTKHTIVRPTPLACRKTNTSFIFSSGDLASEECNGGESFTITAENVSGDILRRTTYSGVMDSSGQVSLNLIYTTSTIAPTELCNNDIDDDADDDVDCDDSDCELDPLCAPVLPSAWLYEKRIIINNPNSYALTNYQIKIELDTSNFDFSGMKSDCSDIRFNDSAYNGLDYWIEKCSTQSAIIWVKVPAIPITGTYIWMYYGNPAAASESDGEETFIFFDDFSANTIGTKWVNEKVAGYSGSPTISGGLLLLDPGDGVYSNIAAKQYKNLRWKGLLSNNAFNKAWRGWNTPTGLSGNGLAGLIYSLVGNPTRYHIDVYYISGYTGDKECDEDISLEQPDDPSDNNWHTFEILWNDYDKFHYLYIDDVLRASATKCQKKEPRIINFVLWSGSGQDKVDWVLVRESAPAEPIVSMIPDTDPPAIDLMDPYDGKIIGAPPNNGVLFMFNASDNGTGLSRCELSIDGTLKKTFIYSGQESAINYTTSDITTAGRHSWSVKCYDYNLPTKNYYTKTAYFTSNCTSSAQCQNKNNEFCNKTNMCELAKISGSNCFNLAYAEAEKNYVCIQELECYQDFDRNGWFCANTNQCVHDSKAYNKGEGLCPYGTSGNLVNCTGASGSWANLTCAVASTATPHADKCGYTVTGKSCNTQYGLGSCINAGTVSHSCSPFNVINDAGIWKCPTEKSTNLTYLSQFCNITCGSTCSYPATSRLGTKCSTNKGALYNAFGACGAVSTTACGYVYSASLNTLLTNCTTPCGADYCYLTTWKDYYALGTFGSDKFYGCAPTATYTDSCTSAPAECLTPQNQANSAYCKPSVSVSLKQPSAVDKNEKFSVKATVTSTDYTACKATISASSSYFDIKSLATVPVTAADKTAEFNLTALKLGKSPVTVLVNCTFDSDTDSESVSIMDCGNDICESSYGETESTCPSDCEQAASANGGNASKTMTLDVQGKCKNEEMTITAKEGSVLLTDITLKINYKEGTAWKLEKQITTTTAPIKYTPLRAADYQIQATKSGYTDLTKTIIIQDCTVICTPAWECLDDHNKRYVNAQCLVTDTQPCPSDKPVCDDGVCSPLPQTYPLGWICLDENTAGYQNAQGDITQTKDCLNCENGECEIPPTPAEPTPVQRPGKSAFTTAALLSLVLTLLFALTFPLVLAHSAMFGRRSLPYWIFFALAALLTLTGMLTSETCVETTKGAFSCANIFYILTAALILVDLLALIIYSVNIKKFIVAKKIRDASVNKLVSYAKKAFESGKSDAEVRAALEKAGWKPDYISKALSKAKTKDPLLEYLYQAKKAGMKKEDMEKHLADSGWPKKDIEKAFKRANL